MGDEEEEPAFTFSGVAGAEEPRPFTIGKDVAAEPFSGVAGADLGFTSGGDTAVSDKTGISSSVSESTARQRRGVRCASVARGVGSFGRAMDAARGELVTARGRADRMACGDDAFCIAGPWAEYSEGVLRVFGEYWGPGCVSMDFLYDVENPPRTSLAPAVQDSATISATATRKH